MKPDWLDQQEYPFESRYFELAGARMHYLDEGQGETILFVHGTPSWSFDFRKQIAVLRDHFRCLAVDHVGFGLSDKPEQYDYGTQNHSRTLGQFALAKDLRDLTLVVHDFGGPIGLNFALMHPERIKRLVILNSWMWSSLLDPDYQKLARVLRSPLLPFLYRWFNFSPRFVLPSSYGPVKPESGILRHYTAPFSKRSEREGPLAFARSLLQDQDWFESLWSQKEKISQKPTLLLWGMQDPVIRPIHLEKFESGFPNHRTIKLDACGHFPQEEKSGQVTQAIKAFMQE